MFENKQLVCKWLGDDLRYTQISVAGKLSIIRVAVGVLANRGGEIEVQLGLGIVERP